MIKGLGIFQNLKVLIQKITSYSVAALHTPFSMNRMDIPMQIRVREKNSSLIIFDKYNEPPTISARDTTTKLK